MLEDAAARQWHEAVVQYNNYASNEEDGIIQAALVYESL
jgi:hypothetical protein